MFGATIRLITGPDGHLGVALPRRSYAVLAVLFSLAAGAAGCVGYPATQR